MNGILRQRDINPTFRSVHLFEAYGRFRGPNCALPMARKSWGAAISSKLCHRSFRRSVGRSFSTVEGGLSVPVGRLVSNLSRQVQHKQTRLGVLAPMARKTSAGLKAEGVLSGFHIEAACHSVSPRLGMHQLAYHSERPVE